MMIKSIRGAITVEENTVQSIEKNTILLLQEVMQANQLNKEQIIQVIFSATKDLDAAYPAKFARAIGWTEVPLFCVQEMAVKGSLAMCLRVMMMVDIESGSVQHVYLKGAEKLRPDWALLDNLPK